MRLQITQISCPFLSGDVLDCPLSLSLIACAMVMLICFKISVLSTVSRNDCYVLGHGIQAYVCQAK